MTDRGLREQETKIISKSDDRASKIISKYDPLYLCRIVLQEKRILKSVYCMAHVYLGPSCGTFRR